MVKTYKPKNRRQRGHTTHGRGKCKNNGSGCRGGVGNAGNWKHKKTNMKTFHGRETKKGFVPKNKTTYEIINLTDISRSIERGEIGKKDNVYYFKFSGKVLVAGELLYPTVVEANNFSKMAIDKIEQVGGEACKIE
jgi:ribosomal protein L15